MFRNPNLSNIVEEPGLSHQLNEILTHAVLFRQNPRVLRHMSGMAEGVVILGIDRRRQSIDGGLVRSVHILSDKRLSVSCTSVDMGSDVKDHHAVFPFPFHGEYGHVRILHQLLDIAGGIRDGTDPAAHGQHL